MPVWGAYAISALLGGVVGLTEILSRYRDAPWAAAKSRAGVLYIAFNGAVAISVLFLIRDVLPPIPGLSDTVAGATTDSLSRLVTQGITAGLGGMAILRSSVMTARVGSKDVEIGPVTVVDILRSTMDRDVARVTATPRAVELQRIMKDVSFIRAWEAISGISLKLLLGSVDAEERARIEQEIGALANRTGRSDEDKTLELGLILADAVGFPALEATKNMLGDRITRPGKERSEMVAEQVSRLDTDAVLRDLPPVCLAMNPTVPDAVQEALRKQIDSLLGSALSDVAKRVTAGLLLVSTVGEENFKAAVVALSGRGQEEVPDPVT